MKALCTAAMLLAPLFGLCARKETPLERAPAREDVRRNPYEGAAAARSAGAKLFRKNCAECHGQNAGGGRHAPALTSPEVQDAAPGALFWVLRNGSLGEGMPSFARLPDQERWQLVTFLKSLSQQHPAIR